MDRFTFFKLMEAGNLQEAVMPGMNPNPKMHSKSRGGPGQRGFSTPEVAQAAQPKFKHLMRDAKKQVRGAMRTRGGKVAAGALGLGAAAMGGRAIMRRRAAAAQAAQAASRMRKLKIGGAAGAVGAGLAGLTFLRRKDKKRR